LVTRVEFDETDSSSPPGTADGINRTFRISRASEPIVGFLTNEAHVEPATVSGTLIEDLTDAGGTFQVYQGAELVNSATPPPTFTEDAPDTVDGLTISIDSAGVYTLSGTWTGDSATFGLSATYRNVTISKEYTISKSKAGADSTIYGLQWGSGRWNISLERNASAVSPTNPGEIKMSSGVFTLPDGSIRALDADASIFTVFESSVNPSDYESDDNYFYLIWGTQNPDTRFAAGPWGSSNAEAAGLFSAIYQKSTEEWRAVDNSGNRYLFTPDPDTDVVTAVGYKSTTAGPSGIDSLTPTVASESSTRSLALSLNTNPNGTPNSGEFTLSAVNGDAANYLEDGFILWDGSKVNVTRRWSDGFGGVTGGTGKGFIAFDTTLGTPFTTASIARDYAFVRKNGSQWQYDSNSSWVNFTPTADYVAIGWLEGDSPDSLIAGGLFEPVTLELAAFPAATLGATSGTDLKDESGTVVSDNDVLNNRLVADWSAGALNANPTFKSVEIDGDGNLKPTGWYRRTGTGGSATLADGFYYANESTRTELTMQEGTLAHTLLIASDAIRHQPGRTYEGVIRAKRTAASQNLFIAVCWYTTKNLGDGVKSIARFASQTFDPELVQKTDEQTATITLTNSYDTYTEIFDQVPDNAEWVSFNISTISGTNATWQISFAAIRELTLTNIIPPTAVNFGIDVGDQVGLRSTDEIRYTFNASGTNKFQNGGGSPPEEDYPWIDSEFTVERGGVEVATLTFRNLGYAGKSTSGRDNFKANSYWRDFTGSTTGYAYTDFTVVINGVTVTDYYLRTSPVYNPGGYEQIQNYDGTNASTYVITVTHDPSGAFAQAGVLNTTITDKPPFTGGSKP
jgi:hypothetical protein